MEESDEMILVQMLRKRAEELGIRSADAQLMKTAANAIEGTRIETAIYRTGLGMAIQDFGADYNEYLHEARQKIILPSPQ